VILSIQPAYDFQLYSSLTTTFLSPVSLEYLLLPSQLQSISSIPFLKDFSLEQASNIYLGPVLILLAAASFVFSKATREEKYFRDMFLLSLIISFPLVTILGYEIFYVPYVAPAFPLLAVLRVPSRFMLFALLFLSIFLSLFIKRISVSHIPNVIGCSLLAIAIAALLLATQWPVMDRFIFNQKVPSFYENLSKDGKNKSIFLYPDLNYDTLLKEIYYQTIHGKNISYGIVSRFPSGGNELFSFYAENIYSYQDVGKASEIIKKFGFDYIVVQKRGGAVRTMLTEPMPLNSSYIDYLNTSFSSEFGAPVFEDDSIIVFSANHINATDK